MINLLNYIQESKLFQTIEIDDLLLVKYECFIDERRSEIWSHNNYFAFVLGGKKKWKTLNDAYLVESEDILFVKKGAHTVYQYFEDPFYVIFIFVDDRFIKNTLFQYGHELKNNSPIKGIRKDLFLVEKNKLLEHILPSLAALFSNEVKSSKELLKLKIEELILALLSQPGNDALKSYFFELTFDKNTQLEQIMKANFNQPLSIREYAQLCARSLSTFRRDFQMVFQTSPAMWLIKKRLEFGKLLLETTDKSINEIVDMTGFKNRSHFLRTFKQTYDIPPSKYRKINILNNH